MTNSNPIAKHPNEPASTALADMDATSLPLAVHLAQVELNQAVTTAQAFPRSLQRARDNITAMVMLDAETAAECIYALPRGGKPIKGPSVRFAEIIASQYGNCHVGSRVIEVNKFEKYVEAEGVFHDLETGMKRTARTRRRILDRNGRLFNDDIILVTSNAACSIALREAILKGVPKALWRAAYEAADAVICGDVKTLSVRRSDALKAFAAFGITPDQIYASLDVVGADEITPEHIGTLTAMFKSIKAGEVDLEEYFPAKADAKAATTAAKGTAAKLSEIASANSKTTVHGHKAVAQREPQETAPPAVRSTSDQTLHSRPRPPQEGPPENTRDTMALEAAAALVARVMADLAEAASADAVDAVMSLWADQIASLSEDAKSQIGAAAARAGRAEK